MSNFNLDSSDNGIEGRWYQLAALPNLGVNTSETCVNWIYRDYSSWIQVEIGWKGPAGRLGRAYYNDSGIGELYFNFDRNRDANAKEKINYYVLDTNYTGFLYVWSCDTLIGGYSPILWIMDRSPSHSNYYIDQAVNKALEILKTFQYRDFAEIYDMMVLTSQRDCDYNIE